MARRTLLALPLLACALAHGEQPAAPKMLERYRQMLAANPVEGTALDRLWASYSEQGKTAELLAEYEGGSSLASEMVLGHLLRKAGRASEAAAAYRRAMALDPKNSLPLLSLARSERAEGRHAVAAKAFAGAVELLPDGDLRKTDALIELGGAWLAAGDAEQAAAAWEKTVALNPQNLDLRRRLAESYVRQRLPERAIVHLEIIVQRAPSPDRAQALQQLANIHQARGHQDAAIAALEKALSYAAPGNWLRTELQSQLIRVHQRYHRERELEQRWKTFAEENPRDLGGYLQLIDLYARLGDQAQELAWLEKLTALAPKNTEHRLRLARLLAETDQLEQATKVYDELLAAQPRNADLLFERARLDLRRDQPQAAGERVAAFVARDPEDESLRGKALEFYEASRLFELAEKQLVAAAASNAEEPLLALANFLFAQRRETNAKAVLARLVDPRAGVAQQAAAHGKAAGLLKAHNDYESAAREIRAAIALHPDTREYHFLLGEIEAARGRYGDAQKGFEQAFAFSRTASEALEADQRLYESLRNQQPPNERPKRGSSAGIGRMETGVATSAAAQGVLLGLLREAVEEPSEVRWLRIARWQMWSRNTRGAADAAAHALSINPASLEAHEFLVKLHAADPQSPMAQKHLRELMRLDPANRLQHLRRIGQAELQAGRFDEALRIFTEIVEASPGSLDALGDLALAQQRADRLTEALATLQNIHQMSPPSRRRDAVNSLLRVYERLAMSEPAAELLLAEIDAATEAKGRSSAFGDLLAHCTKKGLLEWLRGQFDQRRQGLANDYFTEVAFGQILKAQGNKAAAFEVLADAAFSAPQPAESLPELVREAEELRKYGTAIALQVQLVRIVPQQGPAGLERLAQLQERNGQLEDAVQTWNRIVTKFPRDVPALERAVVFQRKHGTPERALEWLRRIVTLDPGNADALSAQAESARASGEDAEAEAAFERVLAVTRPESDGASLRLPLVGTERRSSPKGWDRGLAGKVPLPSEGAALSTQVGPRDLRERAIRGLGELIASRGDTDAIAQWVARWRDSGVAPNEKLLALYAVGASGPLFEEIEALLARGLGDSKTANGFMALALETGEFERVVAWVADRRRTASERDALLVGLDDYLETNERRVDPSLLERLFPSGSRQRLWPAAELFSRRGLFHEAATLGERVFESLGSQRAAVGLQLATWRIALGEIGRAREILRESINTAGESFEAPVYGALRALYLLTPQPQRASLADEYLRRLDPAAQPVHAAITGTVLAGLAGNSIIAEAELGRVLDLRLFAPTTIDSVSEDRSATRHWDFVLSSGVQLQSWGMNSLAESMWARSLADSAWIRLQVQSQGGPVQERARTASVRLAALRLARAEPWEFEESLAEFTRDAPPDDVFALAEGLESAGANSRSVVVFRRVWESDPANSRALSDLLKACRSGDDFTTLEEVLAAGLEDGAVTMNDSMRRDLALQLGELLERRGEWAKARMLLESLLVNAAHETRLIQRLALLHERAGEPALAEAAYRRLLTNEPANSSARLSLAALLDARGQTLAAIECLEQAGGAEADARLAHLYAKTGRNDDAVAALERVPLPGHVPATLLVVQTLAEKGKVREARLLLRGALGRSSDPQTNFPLQSRLVELLTSADGALIPQELRRLRSMAAGESGLITAYFELLQQQGERLQIDGKIGREFAESWDEGRGLLLAGVAQLGRHLRRGERDAARALWTKLSARSDLDELAAEQAASAFAAAGEKAQEVEALGRLARLDAASPERLVRWASALQKLGRTVEAGNLGEELAARAIFDESVTRHAASTFAEAGALDRADELYARAVASDPGAEDHAVYLDYARLLARKAESKKARQILRAAFCNPANVSFSGLVAWLRESGDLAFADEEFASLGLAGSRLAAARGAWFNDLEKAGEAKDAMLLLEKHPEMITAGVAARVRALARGVGAFEEAAALLERVLSQAALAEAEPIAELAMLYVDWADAELRENSTEHALAHLKRAHGLQPELWAAAERLSGAYLARGETRRAAQTLRAFLESSKDPSACEKARQALARVPTS